MEQWVAISEIVLNFAIGLAAVVGSVLALRVVCAERAPTLERRGDPPTRKRGHPTLPPEAFPPIDLHGVFLRRTNWSGTSLRDANLAGTDAAHSNFRGADFEGANLEDTNLSGADLSETKNLTLDQLAAAIIDEETVLPDYIDRAALAARRRQTAGRA